MKSKVITTYMQKGGTGKTTTTSNLAYALSKYGKVLLFDCDAQGNLTKCFMSPKDFQGYNKTLLDALQDEESFKNFVVPARKQDENYFAIDLLGTSVGQDQLKSYWDSDYRDDPARFRMILKEARLSGYAYILIDLPPEKGFYVKEIIALCDEIIPVLNFEEFAMDGFLKFIDSLRKDKVNRDAHYNMQYVIGNKFDQRVGIQRSFLEGFDEIPMLKKIVIPLTADIPNSQSSSILLHEYSTSSKVARGVIDTYDKLAKEIHTMENTNG